MPSPFLPSYVRAKKRVIGSRVNHEPTKKKAARGIVFRDNAANAHITRINSRSACTYVRAAVPIYDRRRRSPVR